MTFTTLEWKPSEWIFVREHLGLTCSDVFDETGIDPYGVENHMKTDREDKVRLAYYYNRLLVESRSDIRMSVTPPKRRK